MPDRQVHQEDPSPGVVVCDPTAECRTNRRSEDSRHAIQRKGETPQARRKRIRQNGLRHRLQAAAASTLNHARDQQNSQAGRDAARERADSKDDDAGHEKALAPEEAYQPAANGENNGIRDQVGSEHPCALILAGAQVPGDVGQGYVGDAGIEHFHEGRERHHKGNQPGVGLRLPVVVFLCQGGSGGAHSIP